MCVCVCGGGGGGGGVHLDEFHSNAENTIIHTFYEELRSGSVLKVS